MYLKTVYKPTDFGAIGDGIYDDGPAINLMFNTLNKANSSRTYIDLSGNWYTRETIYFSAPQASTIEAGSFTSLSSTILDRVLRIDLGSGCLIRGILEVSGKSSSFLKNRNVNDLVHLYRAPSCVFDGWLLSHSLRHALINAQEPGSNIIGCSLGRIKALQCGAPGLMSAPPYSRASSVATNIVRQGQAGSPLQTALLVCDTSTLYGLAQGDYLSLNGKPKDGGAIVEVLQVGTDGVVVTPWPENYQGEGEWPVEAITGGIRLLGGNTTQCSIQGITAQYCGHALHISSLYGCHADAITGEVCGSALTLGARASALFGASIRGLHGERSLVDVLVAGPNVQRTVVISPIEEITLGKNGYHIRTWLADKPSPIAWPLTTIP